MRSFNRHLAKLIALLGIMALAACSTLSVDSVARLRALDLLNDDIADLVLALDVPVELVPKPEDSHFVLSAQKPDGSTISADITLVRADAQEMAEHLPPPAQDRGYYLFGFAEQDKQLLRQTQTAIRDARASGGAGSPEVALNLSFCIVAEVDPNATQFSAHVALPGAGALQPLVSRETVATLLAATGQNTLPACGNFSE